MDTGHSNFSNDLNLWNEWCIRWTPKGTAYLCEMLLRIVKCWWQDVQTDFSKYQMQLKSSGGGSVPSWSKAQTWKSHSSDGAGRDWLFISMKQQRALRHSGDVWNAESTLQVSIWCACGFSAAFGVCNTWAALVSSPQSWKTSNLHPQSSGTLAGSSLSSRARTRGLGGLGSKNWEEEMLLWKESHAISTLFFQCNSRCISPSNSAHPGALWVGWLRTVSRAMQHQHHWSPPLNAGCFNADNKFGIHIWWIFYILPELGD